MKKRETGFTINRNLARGITRTLPSRLERKGRGPTRSPASNKNGEGKLLKSKQTNTPCEPEQTCGEEKADVKATRR